MKKEKSIKNYEKCQKLNVFRTQLPSSSFLLDFPTWLCETLTLSNLNFSLNFQQGVILIPASLKWKASERNALNSFISYDFCLPFPLPVSEKMY